MRVPLPSFPSLAPHTPTECSPVGSTYARRRDGGPSLTQYKMTLSLNVLRHLGVSLYSSTPAVLSEVVANAWDADATEVNITLDSPNKRIVIQDNGVGMTAQQLNERYLKVGYERRNGLHGARTAKERPVMGRKGIGKLALFSIAKTVLIETASGVERNALQMDFDEIQKFIKQESDNTANPGASADYAPKPLDGSSVDFPKGTRITLTNLTKGIDQTGSNLRRRLARRFSVIGTKEFVVNVDGKAVEVTDRDLLPKTQYVWTYGDTDNELAPRATSSKETFTRPPKTAYGDVTGWLGTVHSSDQLKEADSDDSLNRVPLMVRGKLAQEDLLAAVRDVGIYRSYVVGELHADWLDSDDEEDIATSSRQALREDDPRYMALIEFLKEELQHIKGEWDRLRDKAGTKAAKDIPEVKAWYKTLGPDSQKKAHSLFGKIHRLGLNTNDESILFSQGVVAFEVMKYRENLDALDKLSGTDVAALGKLLQQGNQLEEVMYHRIVSQRLAIIEKLEKLTSDDAKERFLQEHLFDHLWLLDPGWERASMPSMEKSMKTEFKDIAKSLTTTEANSRLDIRYQKTTGQHVIVELKRATVSTSSAELAGQIGKYRNALVRWLRNNGKENDTYSLVCVLGKPPKDWSDEDGRETSRKMMSSYDARIVLYSELLNNAREAYDEYLRKSEEANRIQQIVDAVATRAK